VIAKQLWRVGTSLALLLLSAQVSAQVVIGRFEFANGLLKGEATEAYESDQSTTNTIQVYNNTTQNYRCSARVGYYSLTNGSGGFPVTGEATAPPGGPWVIVSARNPYRSGYATNINLMKLDCTPVSTGDAGGGGGGTGGGGGANRGVLFTGTVGYRTNSSANSIDLNAQKITNTDTGAGGRSGSLKLELWALSAPYSGSGGVRGYKVAAARVPTECGTGGTLATGSSCSNISVTSSYTKPPAGTYTAAMFLTEFSSTCQGNEQYCIEDYLNFSNPLVIEQAADTRAGGIELNGTASYELDFGTSASTLKIAEIRNTGNTGSTSGTLRIELWALAAPYEGRQVSGTRLLSSSLPSQCSPNSTLPGGLSCKNITISNATLTKPPAGTYNVALVVTQYDSRNCTSSDQYCVANAINFDGTLTVSSAAPVTPPPATSNPPPTSSGGGGGGGAMDPFVFLVLLLVCAVFQVLRVQPFRKRR